MRHDLDKELQREAKRDEDGQSFGRHVLKSSGECVVSERFQYSTYCLPGCLHKLTANPPRRDQTFDLQPLVEMEDIPQRSDLYIKVAPKPKDKAKKLNRRGGNAELHAQFASETPSATSLASDQPSSKGATQSSATSQSTHHIRRYTITASKTAPSGPAHDKLVPTKSTQKAPVAGTKPKDPSVVISRSSIPKGKDKLHRSRLMTEPSEQEIPPEAWWNQQTGMDEPMRALTVDSRQHDDSGSAPSSSLSRIPRPEHRRYPPTSYREPSAPEDEGDMYDDQPRLPPNWKPPAHQPAPGPAAAEDKPAKHVRPRRLSGPASTKTKRPSPSPTPNQAVPTKHTRAATSIDIAPTPYSSPEMTAPIAAHSRSRSTSHTSAFSQRTRRSEGNHLPPPEDVYGQSMYFTQCPHTSPPANRPLDIQPVLQPLSLELFKQPSHAVKTQLHLAARTGRQREIYTISGLCPVCDWKARRDAESKVLMDFAQRRYQMEVRLAHLEMQEGEEEPASPLTPEQPAHEPKEEQMDLQLKMLMLESDIEELEALENREVKKVWKGFASRWGPGAVGIQRGENEEGGEGGSREDSSTTASTLGTASSVDNVQAEGRMKLDWIRPDVRKD